MTIAILALILSTGAYAQPSPGVVAFERDGREWRIHALPGDGDVGSLWLVFGDATNGHETYGGGRFLYTASPADDGSVVVSLGDVMGKGVPAALYSVFAAELVRSRTFRRRYMPERFSPAGVLMSINTILYERQLEGYYCTLCYAYFDLKRRTLTMANSGLPYTLNSTPVPEAMISGPPISPSIARRRGTSPDRYIR